MNLALTSAPGRLGMKPRRTLSHPCNEFGQTWVRAQALDRIELARQLSLAQRGMDFVMANLMKQHGRSAFATPQFRDKVMKTLARIRRNCATAQRTNGISHGT